MMQNPHPKLDRHTPEGVQWADALAWISGGFWIDANHLLHGPGVATRLIPEASTQGKITPRTAILHTNAGSSGVRSLWSWITRKDVNGEPHFQVASDGGVEQYMPLTRRADCNYSANAFAISYETQDNGSATLDRDGWTLEQLAAVIGSLTAICVTYGVQCTQPSTWAAGGIGHHSLHPFQGVGRPAWTNVRGKTCPGRARIAQMDFIRQAVAERLADFIQATGWSCGE
jgi:hypothetical protein